jgi:hypothetical protein
MTEWGKGSWVEQGNRTWRQPRKDPSGKSGGKQRQGLCETRGSNACSTFLLDFGYMTEINGTLRTFKTGILEYCISSPGLWTTVLVTHP